MRGMLIVMLVAVPACGQSLPSTMPGGTGGAATGPATTMAAVAVSAEARALLDMLEKRGETLKDFLADVDYSVYKSKLDDYEASDGFLAYIKDATGAKFSFRQVNLKTGNPPVLRKMGLQKDIVFDGEWLTFKDREAKTYRHVQVAKPGMGGAVMKLDGPVPMPIGQKTADVVRDYFVRVLESKDANQVVLQLIPRTKGRTDFTELVVTVDKALELPVKMVSTAVRGDVTTITLKDAKVNAGKAKMIEVTAPPAGAGWEVKEEPLPK